MVEVAVNGLLHDCLPSPKAKRNTWLSSGRGGSGNIRGPQVPVHDEPSVTLRGRAADKRPERSEPPSERRATEQSHFASSGRGGSGNIRWSMVDLEDHPLTASILSQHSAVQAQYEGWVRKAHAESKIAHSSGRGGSGNISDVRRRSHSQGSSTAPKRHFFTRKGREKGTKGRNEQDREDRDADRRNSCATYSSGGSSSVGSRYSQENSDSGTVTSSDSVLSDPSSGEVITGNLGKRLPWSKPSLLISSTVPPRSPRSPSVPVYSPSSRYESFRSSSRVFSLSPAISEDREYVSFLEF